MFLFEKLDVYNKSLEYNEMVMDFIQNSKADKILKVEFKQNTKSSVFQSIINQYPELRYTDFYLKKVSKNINDLLKRSF